MKTTAFFLDELRLKLGLPSDGRLADHLGMHRQHVSRYRTLTGTFDDEMSIRVAQILEIEPAFVIACMHHQRAKSEPERAAWQRIADLVHDHAAIAAAVLVALALPFVSFDGLQYGLMAASTAATSPTVYIMTNGLLQYWPVFLALFALLLWAFSGNNPAPKESRTQRPD